MNKIHKWFNKQGLHENSFFLGLWTVLIIDFIVQYVDGTLTHFGGILLALGIMLYVYLTEECKADAEVGKKCK